MKPARKRLDEIEAALDNSTSTNPLSEWILVVRIGLGDNATGTHARHYITGEEIHETDFVEEVRQYGKDRMALGELAIIENEGPLRLSVAWPRKTQGGSHG